MAKPSRKGAKSGTEVAAEAKRKKDILDKVAQSNLPTKTILKELGISRSTYYSWLKRYEEEGEEGLLDSRSLAKAEVELREAVPPVEEEGPQPSAVVGTEEVAEERPAESVGETIIEEEPTSPMVEPEVVKPEEPVTATVEDEPEGRIEEVAPKETVPFGGVEEKRGMGGYAFIVIVLLVIGLVFSVSLSNYKSYQLRQSGDTLTLWKGKFAPRGFAMVESFEPLAIGESDVSALTSRTFTGQDAVHKAIYAFILDQINAEVAKGNEADSGKISRLLAKAEGLVGPDLEGDRGLANIRYQLAEKRVAMAEMELQNVYKAALPAYQEAASMGLADVAMLEAKIQAMQEALELAPMLTPEAEAEEAKPAVAPEAEVEEAETAVAPETEPKEAETAAATEAESQEAEPVVVVESPAKKGETAAAPTETAKPEEEAEEPTSFLEWIRSRMQE